MWMHAKEKEFLLSTLRPDYTIFEYGAGYSTLEIPQYVKNHLSVEHNWNWYVQLSKEKLPPNCFMKFVPNDLPWNSTDGTLEEFKNYIESSKYFGPYNVVYIDGRARVECSKFIVDNNLLKDDGFILWHDFGPEIVQQGAYRQHYDVALEWLEEIDHVLSMYRFKIK